MEINLNIGGHELYLAPWATWTLSIFLYLVVGWLACIRKFFNNELAKTSVEDFLGLLIGTALFWIFWLPGYIIWKFVWPVLKFTAPFWLTKENRK